MKYKTELTNNFHNNSTFFDDQRGIATMYDDFEDDLLFTPEQMLENRGRVAIFIDGSNLAQTNGSKIWLGCCQQCTTHLPTRSWNQSAANVRRRGGPQRTRNA